MKARSRTSHTALALAVGLAAGLTTPLAAGRADAASGTVFEVAPVIAEIKRQLTAVDAGASAAGPGGLRIEDAQLDLALVENPAGGERTSSSPAPITWRERRKRRRGRR